MGNFKHLLMVPFTGLGLYRGFRGNRWLKNRIKVFEQFVVPSLLAQTSQDFIVWVAWRNEEKSNKIVNDFKKRLEKTGLKFVHTYSGCPFWDDKYPDDIAKIRLIDAIHGSMGELINMIGECEHVLMTIQPSDDCYHSGMVDEVQREIFKDANQVVGYKHGYIMDYKTQEVREYNPETNPPFFTIRFPRETFIDPLKHIEYTGPYKSHEFVVDYLKHSYLEGRGFLVGIHGFNISTVFDHPYAGDRVDQTLLGGFGLLLSEPLEVKFSVRSWIFSKMPYQVKRKLRFWSGEKKWILRPFFALIYNTLRD